MKYFFLSFFLGLMIKGPNFLGKGNKLNNTKLKQQLVKAFKDFHLDKGKKALPLVKKWISVKKDPDFSPLDHGRSMLLFAAYYGNYEICKILLEAKANPNLAKEDGFKALHLAAINGHEKIIKILLSKNIDVNVATDKGYTALYLAASYEHFEAMKILLEHPGIKVNKITQENKSLPIHISSSLGNVRYVKLLLEKKSHINSLDNYGQTPLFYAAQNAHLDVVKLLLKNYAAHDLTRPGGVTPYAIAFSNIQGEENPFKKERYLGILDLLKAQGADTTKRTSAILGAMNKLGYTIDEKGVCYGIAFMAVQALLRRDFDAFLLRMKKIQDGSIDQTIKKIILKWKKQDDLSLRPRERALYKLNQDEINLLGFFDGIALYFISKNNIINYPSFQNWRREFQVFSSAKKPRSKSSPARVPITEEINLEDIQMKAGLVLNSDENLLNLIQWLQKQEGSLVLALHSLGHTVSLNRNKDGRLYLVNHDYITEIKADSIGVKVIGEAIAYQGIFLAEVLNHKKLNLVDEVDFLLETKDDFKSQKILSLGEVSQQKILEQSLFLAVKNGYSDLTENILFGLNSIMREKIKDSIYQGFTLLLEASYRGFSDIVDILIRYKFDVNKAHKTKDTALHFAAKNGFYRVAELLVTNGARVDNKNSYNATALQYSAEKGHYLIAKLLLENLANPNIADKDGYTPLILSSYRGDIQVMELLLKHRAQINIEDRFGFSPLKAAIFGKKIEAVKILLKKGALVNQESQLSLSPLSLAARWGSLDIIKILVRAGAHIGTEGKSKALNLAFDYNHQEVVNYLVAEMRKQRVLKPLPTKQIPIRQNKTEKKRKRLYP